MTKFGKIFCNLVANFKGVQLQGVQLSPLGFAVCHSKNCTNKTNSANYRRVWHPAIPTQPPNYLPTEATETTEVSGARYSPTEPTEHTETTGARYSPTDCTDVHRLGGYGILPYPRSYKTIFPQKPTQPNHLCASVRICGRLFSARSFCEFREFRGRTPRTHQTIFPQKPQKPQKFLAQDILPQNPRNTQKRLAQGILPQIARMCTD